MVDPGTSGRQAAPEAGAALQHLHLQTRQVGPQYPGDEAVLDLHNVLLPPPVQAEADLGQPGARPGGGEREEPHTERRQSVRGPVLGLGIRLKLGSGHHYCHYRLYHLHRHHLCFHNHRQHH